jgi:hypothetical protein
MKTYYRQMLCMKTMKVSSQIDEQINTSWKVNT